ncbi:gentisatedioxygenase [Diaporthe eres]|nr:gentisatedioxygenase [Diaporthe eres]
MKARLDGAAGDWAELRYLKSDGSGVSKTLGRAASRLNAGKASPIVQETASSVYHVVEGSGYSTIGGKIFAWEKGDTFCIPSWYPYQHFASDSNDGSPVYLYRFDDKHGPCSTPLGFTGRLKWMLSRSCQPELGPELEAICQVLCALEFERPSPGAVLLVPILWF